MRTLRIKFLLSVTSLILLSSIASVLFIHFILSRELLEEIQTRGVRIAKDIARQGVSYILTNDLLEMRILVNGYKRAGTDIEYIYIADQHNKILMHTFKEGFPSELKASGINKHEQVSFSQGIHSFFIGKEKFFDIAAPIMKGQVGFVHLGISEKFIKKTVNRIIRLIMVSLSVIFFLAILGGMILVRFITQPILRLKKVIGRIIDGDFSSRVSITSQDEIGALGNVFNKMVDDLMKTTVSRDQLEQEIVERKQIELVLKKSQGDLADIVNFLPDALFVIDIQGKVIIWNEAAEKMTGIARKDILGKSNYEYAVPFYGDRKPSLIDLIINPGIIGIEKDYSFINQDGDTLIAEARLTNVKKENIYVLIKACPLYDENNKIIGAIETLRDITESKQAEEKLIQAFKEGGRTRGIMISMLADNNQVNERLAESLRKLQKAQGHLIHAEKMDAIGRMASGVAHEVKNPLGIILQGINYFEGVLLPEAKDNHEILQMMKDSVKRADNIVRTLLDFSRAEELATDLQEINTVIKGSLDLVQHRLKLNSIELVCELANGLPKLSLHKGKIEQVFINLFDNAVDVMPNGGKLYVRSYLSKLKTAENKVGDRENDTFRLGEETLIVEVEDTGPGIDADIKVRIFDPFFTTKNRTEGTGLGLSVAKGIIEMHSGLIKVESEKGKGAKFILAFKIPHLRKE